MNPLHSPARVAVTGIGGDVGQGIITGLRQAPFPVWILGFDCAAQSPHFAQVDQGVTSPLIRAPNYIDFLIDTLQKYQIDILMTGIDSEVLLLAKARATIEAATHTRVIVSEEALVTKARDKLDTARWFEFLALHPPKTLPGDASLAHIETHIGYPAIVKPRWGNGSKGVCKVEHRDALVTRLSQHADGPRSLCVQSYIEGPEFTCGLLYDDAGQLCDWLVMRRWLKQGRTVRAQVETRPGIETLLKALRELPGARGALNLQLRVDQEGRARVFEVNARLSGSTSMRIAVGFNDPARVVSHFLFHQPLAPAQVTPARVYRLGKEVVVVPDELAG